MAHLKHTTTRAETTDPRWLGVGRAVGQLANEWSGRNDLIGYVGRGAGGGSPACYNPTLAEVEVNTELAFGPTVEPETVGDLTVRSTQYEFPVATGSIYHEAFHARFSRYDLAEAARILKDDEHTALMLLEECRVEQHGVAVVPAALPFLRAGTLAVVIGDVRETLPETGVDSVGAAAQLTALVLARVDAGILLAEDVEGVTGPVEAFLGPEVVAELLGVSRRFRAHERHYDPAPLYDLAREWVAILNREREERGEQGQDGDAAREFAEFLSGLLGELADAAEESGLSASQDLADQQTSEEWAEEARARAAGTKERERTKQATERVFPRSSSATPEASGSASRLVETRQPTSDERIAAVTVSSSLDRARYRDRDATEVTSVVPPGRLRTRALVQAAALRERGVAAKVEPWRRTTRRATDDPTLRVGVMVDISGSMSSAMQPMATTAWVMSEAVRRVQGRCAMVYYGSGVFPTLRPGEHLREVRVYTAPDGTEKFDEAFRALDGSLLLTEGTGARLLVVVSDAHYTSHETERAKHWLARAHESGVAVLWLPFDEGSRARFVVGRSGEVIPGRLDPSAAAREIGAAATRVLSAASAA